MAEIAEINVEEPFIGTMDRVYTVHDGGLIEVHVRVDGFGECYIIYQAGFNDDSEHDVWRWLIAWGFVLPNKSDQHQFFATKKLLVTFEPVKVKDKIVSFKLVENAD